MARAVQTILSSISGPHRATGGDRLAAEPERRAILAAVAATPWPGQSSLWRLERHG